MSINWYPGHMKKTKDLIVANLKMVDAVVELLDARIPVSSRNPQFDNLIGSKKRIIALNKSDLSDPEKLKQWVNYYGSLGIKAIPINSLGGAGVSQLLTVVKNECQGLIKQAEAKGRLNRPIRIMIIGIPNVGKSSLINKLAGKNAAKTGNKPGITKGKQWIRLNKDIELFDTPGILWPKIEEDFTGIKLAATGAIKDEILNIDDIAYEFIKVMKMQYESAFMQRYQLDTFDEDPIVVMDIIGRKRGCLARGNEIDYEKVSRLILDEFRKGLIGQMTIEVPEINANRVMADE